MTTRSVLLDFGNVIAFFDHRKACRQLTELSTAAMTADDIYTAIFNTTLEEAYDAGRMSTPAFLDTLRTALHLQADDDEIARVGCRKPDPRFCRACLTAARCPAAECLYVDDRKDLVVAGHKLGLHGLVYTPAVDVLAHTCY